MSTTMSKDKAPTVEIKQKSYDDEDEFEEFELMGMILLFK